MNYNNTIPTPEQAAEIKESLKAQLDKVPDGLLSKYNKYDLAKMLDIYNHFCDLKMQSIPTLIVSLNEAVDRFTRISDETGDLEFTPEFISQNVYNLTQVSNFLAMATAY